MHHFFGGGGERIFWIAMQPLKPLWSHALQNLPVVLKLHRIWPNTAQYNMGLFHASFFLPQSQKVFSSIFHRKQ